MSKRRRPSMGHKQKMNGLEVDVVYARGLYCSLKNNPNVVAFAKKAMNKRERSKSRAMSRSWDVL